MPRQSPADDLAETLADLARLRLRAARLRALIAGNPDLGATGRFARAEVRFRQDKVFDPALLPPDIRNDPRYLRAHDHWTVHCTAVPRTPDPRPGWPIRRDSATALH